MQGQTWSGTGAAITRQRLVDSLESTRGDLDYAVELLRSKGEDDWDIDEPMLDGSEWQMVMARQEILEARIEELEEALNRLDEGTYGVCQECGQPIAAGRIEARPEVRRCVDCESRVEEGM